MKQTFPGVSLELWACRDCGLVFHAAGAGLVREDVSGFNYGFFDAFRNHPLMFGTEVRRLSRFLGVRNLTGRELVDVGCGNGLFLEFARGEGARVTGIELNGTLRQATRDRGIPAFETLADALQENAGKFDVVYCSHTLEHFIDPFAALKQMYALLAPGGVLQVTVPCLNRLTFILQRTLVRLGIHSGWGIFYAVHLTYFNRGSLRSILARSGFADLRFHHGVLGENLLRKAFRGNERAVRRVYRYLLEPALTAGSWVGFTPNLSVLGRK